MGWAVPSCSLCNPTFKRSWSFPVNDFFVPSLNPVRRLRKEKQLGSPAASSRVSTELEVYRENQGDTTLPSRAVHCVRRSSSSVIRLTDRYLRCYCYCPRVDTNASCQAFTSIKTALKNILKSRKHLFKCPQMGNFVKAQHDHLLL